MTYEYRAIITNEVPGVDTVVVRTWLTKPGEEKPEERAFLLPENIKLTESDPIQILDVVVNQTLVKNEAEKAASKKRAPRRKKEDNGE